MSESRNARTSNSSTASSSSTANSGAKSLDSLSASMNRALAGARAPQVAAERREQIHRDLSDAGGRRAAARSAAVAARRRTNFLLGTLDGLRRGAGAPARARDAGRSPA
ncbi:hypothetical protein [Pseudofrankia saprophytica]|uniref:hypothetical protein n=1 Tax=Pseudofrankia saprophytica TaxID=298655 RepID=UPI000234D182|nr:hypothetical protein [Pseudofrankia saprophytica]